MAERLRRFLDDLERSSKTPTFVKALSDIVAEWRGSSGRALIRLRGVAFDELYYMRVNIPMTFDFKDRFVARINVIPEDRMDDRGRELYRRLKMMEVVLRWRGIIRRAPRFELSPAVKLLLDRIPGLSADPRLAERLMSDKELLGLISKVRPDELIVDLQSFDEAMLMTLGSPEEAEVYAFHHPTEVTWRIHLTTVLLRGPGYRQRALSIVHLLDRIARAVREITASVSEEL